MADALKSKKPVPDKTAQPPETHRQTTPVERKISPQHNTTERYGRSDKAASDQTKT